MPARIPERDRKWGHHILRHGRRHEEPGVREKKTCLTISPAARSFDHIDVAGINLGRIRAALFGYGSVGALNIIMPQRTLAPTGHSVGMNDSVAGQHGCCHLLPEPDPPNDAVATAVFALTARSTPDRKRIQDYREPPFQNFRVGQASIGHMRMDAIRSVKIRPGPGAAADGFVILIISVAEGEVIHSALGRAH